MDGTGICTTCGADTEEQKEMCPDCEQGAPESSPEEETPIEPAE